MTEYAEHRPKSSGALILPRISEQTDDRIESSGGISRRQWLRLASASGVAALAAATNPCSESLAFALDQEPDNGAIDAHAHIWTRETDRFPLREGRTVEDLDPASFTDAELLRIANRSKVDRVVLIAHHIYYGFDNRYLIHAAESQPGTFKVVGMIDDLSEHPDEQMKRLVDRQVSGFRITPWIHGDGWLASDGMSLMWKTAAETGQAICCLIDAENLPEVDRMCQRFGDTRVVIDHMARIGVDGRIRDNDVRQLCELARHENVFVKISAFYALGKKRAPYDDLAPLIRRVYDAYGAEHLMWASDAPYQVVDGHTYAASIDLIRERLDFLSDADRDQMLRRTAANVYRFEDS